MKYLSLTARISLLFAVAACLVLLTTGYFLARAVENHLKEEDRIELHGKLDLIQNLFKQPISQRQQEFLPRQLGNALVGHPGLAVVVQDGGGKVWFSTPGADFPRALLQDCQTQSVNCTPGVLQEWKLGGANYRGMAMPITTSGGKPYTVVVAQDIEHHERFMDKFRFVLAIAVALATLTTASLGWLVTRWGLFPVHQVINMVAGVSAKHLSDRLPATGLPTELKPLVTAFNAMLTRLDDSFRRLSEFSANIAHELRTPISNLMTQTQVALASARGNDEYKEILYSSLEEYERMAQMVSDMLYLAQTDTGQIKPGLEKVNLADETQGLFDYFEAWAEERAVSLSQEGAATVPGDRLMLRRALSNLISNAVRHTPQGQTVHVSLHTTNNKAIVSVENPGPEIPAEHLPKLFERFYRADPSRQRTGDGAGLGLAIVRSIVEVHGGSISVTSANGTTRFQLTLPALRE